MVTRATTGICCLNRKYTMATTTSPAAPTQPISPIPKSTQAALQDANWVASMQSEFDALMRKNTWMLVDRPPGVRVITGKWVWK
jgi:hypothetical protein